MHDDQQHQGGALPQDAASDNQKTGGEKAEPRSGKVQPADDGLKPENVNPLAPPINVEGGG